MGNEPAASRPIIAALRAMLRDRPASSADPGPARPFVTISRQAGAGAHPLAGRLVERFNADKPDPPWRFYDRELIEKVAEDHGLSEALVASVPDRPQSLLADLVEGMRFDRSRPTDEYVYRKVIATIRALAQLGHTVIVGRGGAYCTQDLSGGVHVRLVASMASRVRYVAQRQGMAEADAAERIEQIQQRRDRFYNRFWPGAVGNLDRFSIAINTDAVGLDQQVQIIGQLVAARSAH
jgi:cytidylate kinase